MALLEIENLDVTFTAETGELRAANGVSLTIEEGEILGIVGGPGSGKTASMLAVIGLVGYPGQMRARRLCFAGRDLLTMPKRELRQLAGKDIAMIFQDPAASLNPSFTVGYQIMEILRAHEGLSSREARERSIALLARTGVPDPEAQLCSYPRQLSEDMSQRVKIAMAIACNPRLLIADEPGAALEPAARAQILDLLAGLQKERGMALILLTRSMGVAAQLARRIAVMRAGRIVEERQAQR